MPSSSSREQKLSLSLSFLSSALALRRACAMQPARRLQQKHTYVHIPRKIHTGTLLVCCASKLRTHPQPETSKYLFYITILYAFIYSRMNGSFPRDLFGCFCLYFHVSPYSWSMGISSGCNVDSGFTVKLLGPTEMSHDHFFFDLLFPRTTSSSSASSCSFIRLFSSSSSSSSEQDGCPHIQVSTSIFLPSPPPILSSSMRWFRSFTR